MNISPTDIAVSPKKALFQLMRPLSILINKPKMLSVRYRKTYHCLLKVSGLCSGSTANFEETDCTP
jgi:hypothetical protein